jgi:hypothetical protein
MAVKLRPGFYREERGEADPAKPAQATLRGGIFIVYPPSHSVFSCLTPPAMRGRPPSVSVSWQGSETRGVGL